MFRIASNGRVMAAMLAVVICAAAIAQRRGIAEEPAAPAAGSNQSLPQAIQDIFDKPLYKNAAWALRVVDAETGEVLCDVAPEKKFLLGSVRKLFSVGLALDKLGADHRFKTPVYAHGELRDGVLHGDLILVASGDLMMGGRDLPDGTMAITDFDHNEANSLGNARLTETDPLAGFKRLAKQVAEAGIKEVTGDVVIDDRLFAPFDFRGEMQVRPIFVNDNVVDVMIRPRGESQLADVNWRPRSAAFGVRPAVRMTPAGSAFDIELHPEQITCLGSADCVGGVRGSLPVGFVPPFVKQYPLVRTFRITEPQDYARIVFIEALRGAGVKIEAATVGKNDAARLPDAAAFAELKPAAELVSLPYAQNAKHILKVSYNIGADTSLVLFGLTQGEKTMAGALAAERKVLSQEYGIGESDFHFIDGSGGGETAATAKAVTDFLLAMRGKPFYETYRQSLPALAQDGSLGFVTDFKSDASLAGAQGNVHAKTGTFVFGTSEEDLTLRAQALAGYMQAKSGRQLAFFIAVNDVHPITGLEDVSKVFQDQGTIAAILWREN